MKNYKKNGKTYKVSEIAYGGAIVNVNGTSITDYSKMYELTQNKLYKGLKGYSVFYDSNELTFATFEQAYNFALRG